MTGPRGYGSTSGLSPEHEDYLHGMVHVAAQKVQLLRRRWNTAGYMAAVLVPWAIFAGVLAVVSFPLRVQNQLLDDAQLCFIVCSLALAVVLVFGFFAFVAWRRRTRYGFQEPTWFSFIFLAGLASWTFGIVLGRVNYRANLAPYYAVLDLNFYKEVDPAVNRGSELMDAGRITFAAGSYINRSMSESYRDGTIYCVAPIVSGDKPLATYDFWAVGTGCCTDHSPTFHCGAYPMEAARSGIRLKNPSRYYTLALEQAQAAFGIRSRKPIFVKWVADPSADIERLRGESRRFYVEWIFLDMAFQFVVVTGCAAALWYLGGS
uniref:Uncharacterized protein n=1 Tax=Alexandrium monilatum TaxID=311494 RepID=A0A7S4T835_9DINO